MSTVVAYAVLGLSDTTRPFLLIGFVVALFGVAGLAVVIGRRRLDRQQALKLSEDTGVDKGAIQGGDASHSEEWLNQTRDEVDSAPKQNWQDLILGPGAVHLDGEPGTEVLAPEIAAQRVSAQETQQAQQFHEVAPEPVPVATPAPVVVSPESVALDADEDVAPIWAGEDETPTGSWDVDDSDQPAWSDEGHPDGSGEGQSSQQEPVSTAEPATDAVPEPVVAPIVAPVVDAVVAPVPPSGDLTEPTPQAWVDDLGVAPVFPPAPLIAPTVPPVVPATPAVVAPSPVPTYDTTISDKPSKPGKHAARPGDPVRQTPFLVDDFLDDED